MKNTSKKSFISCAFIIVALCLTFALATFNFNADFARAEESPSTKIAYIGEEINAEDFEISYSGGTVKAEGFTVVYPSGGVYGGKGFEIPEAGNYTVTYYATVGGERVEETVVYTVVRKPKDVIIAENGMNISVGKYEIESPYTIQNETYGAIVEFKAGQSITFATKIKTEKLTKDYDIFDLIVMPSVFGETDFERLTVRVSDANDSTNYVEIIVDSSNSVDGGGKVSYVRAGANGQQYGGHENSNYHTSYPYGTQVEHSFRGTARVGDSDFSDTETVSENSLTLSIDHEERKVYCGPTASTSTAKLLVNDLDDSAHYKANPWMGFTSGEVEVKITAGTFTKSVGKVLIKRFADLDFSTDIVDKNAPQITLDYDFTEKTPVAVVGEDFPIFSCESKDDLDVNLVNQVLVYHIDDLDNRISVETDGETFTPNYEGKYEIVYISKDYSGNVAKKTVQIDAVTSAPKIFIDVTPKQSASVFSTVDILQSHEVGIYGGSGSLSVERTVISPNAEILDVKDKLVLTQLGDYKVIFTVRDYLGNVQYGVTTITSTEISAPIFVEEPKFDEIFIKGFTYEIPKAKIIETVDGQIVELESQVFINGEIAWDSFVADGEEINIYYYAEGETGAVEREFFVPVKDTQYGGLRSKYFYTENVNVEDGYEYVTISASKDGKAKFINPLSTKNFLVSFKYQDSDINFSGMKFVLTDSQNASVKVTVEFTYDADTKAWFIKSNGSSKKVAFTTSKGSLTFSYSSTERKIVDTSGIGIDTITVTDEGDAFTDFSSKIYFEMQIFGVEDDSQMFLTQICNQSMGYAMTNIEDAMDDIEPIISLDEPFINRQKLNAKAFIPTAKAFDVLGQITAFTVTVVGVDGEVLAKGPADKPVDVVLSKAGNYRVTYSAEDSNGNPKTASYIIMVNDETAPTLNVENKLKKEYKVGDAIKIPSYSATDNGENCYIQVTLIKPNNEMRLLHYVENGKVQSFLSKENDHYENAFKVDDNTFKVNDKGRYVLRIVAYDEYYNYTVKEIEFIVK